MNVKWKILLFSLVLVFTVIACNIGAATPTPVVLTGNEAAQQTLDAIVALTAAAVESLPSATPPSVVESTEPPPTSTLPPVNTATATQTPTLTPPPSPTSPAGDPKESLGNPDWVDRFDKDDNWYLYDESKSRAEIKDGKFFYTQIETRGFDEWTVSWPEIKNFYLEVSAQTPSACSGRDRYGLLFRAPDTTQGYLLAFSCGGEYRLHKWDGSKSTELIGWTSSTAILSGPNKINRLGVKAEGDKISVYANGVFLGEATDSSYTAENRFGLFIAAVNTPNFTIVFDDISYWKLP